LPGTRAAIDRVFESANYDQTSHSGPLTTKHSTNAATNVAIKVPARAAPAPETRPTTIEGWIVREVDGATAFIEGPDDAWRAARGDVVPGVGRIDSIVRWGDRWIVATSSGLISTR
jgi:hypothetical protein